LVSGRDQKEGRGVGPNPKDREKHGGLDANEWDDEFVEALKLVVQKLHSTLELADGHAGRVTDEITLARAKGCSLGDEL
jgi:hypothetical protein